MPVSKVDNIFLIGAGASFGSEMGNPLLYDEKEKFIPLYKDLYNTLKKEFKSSWGSISGDLDAKISADFESGFSQIHKGELEIKLQLDLAIFFSEYRIYNSKKNLYCRLIRELKNSFNLKSTVFSTLNYDCLIEQACELEGCGYDYNGGTSKDGIIGLLKIHGSCNFLVDVDPNNQPLRAKWGSKLSNIVYEKFRSKAIHYSDVKKYCENDEFIPIPPIMCRMMEKKPVLENKETILELQSRWKEYVSKAKKIFIIGANPMSSDPHIWENIKNANGKIFWCLREEKFDKWKRDTNRKNDVLVSKKFDKHYIRTCLNEID